MTRMQDEASYRAKLWQRIQLASERLRLIEGIKRLPEPERRDFAPWIDFLEHSPEEYPRLKHDMERIGFDLRALMAPAQPELSVHLPGTRRGVVVPLSPLAANDSLATGYRKVANFSTSEATDEPPGWAGEEKLGEDIVRVHARPDPFGKRVQLTIWIDTPSSVRPGAVLFVALSGSRGLEAPAQVELRKVDDRIQGVVSVPMKWSDFVAHAGSGVLLSSEALPDEDGA